MTDNDKIKEIILSESSYLQKSQLIQELIGDENIITSLINFCQSEVNKSIKSCKDSEEALLKSLEELKNIKP